MNLVLFFSSLGLVLTYRDKKHLYKMYFILFFKVTMQGSEKMYK